jgi:hypothetical protein
LSWISTSGVIPQPIQVKGIVAISNILSITWNDVEELIYSENICLNPLFE